MRKGDEKTREGREVFPINAPIRYFMAHGTLCARCRHAADLCRGISRRVELVGGYNVVRECEGYEAMADAGNL